MPPYKQINEDGNAEKGKLTRMIDSLETDYTLSLPGVIFDPEEAAVPDYLKDTSVCNGLVHRSTITGVLRFVLPLVAVCYNAYSYAVCCPEYKAYLYTLCWILAMHLLIGAYPLLCCPCQHPEQLCIRSAGLRECPSRASEIQGVELVGTQLRRPSQSPKQYT